jgi:hypothetical protein
LSKYIKKLLLTKLQYQQKTTTNLKSNFAQIVEDFGGEQLRVYVQNVLLVCGNAFVSSQKHVHAFSFTQEQP